MDTSGVLTGALIAAGVGDTEDTTVAAIRKYLKSRLPPTARPVAADDNDTTSASLFADADVELTTAAVR